MSHSTVKANDARRTIFEVRIEALSGAVLEAARELTAARGRCFVKHLIKHPRVVAAARSAALPNCIKPTNGTRDGVGRKLVEKCLARLEADREVIRLGRRSGYKAKGIAPRPATLADVLAAAEVMVTDKDRLAKLTTSARLISEGVTGRKGAADQVGIGHLLWESTQRHWAILPRVERWSRELRNAEASTTEAHRIYAAQLLDIGATAGILTRGELRLATVRAATADLQPLLTALTLAACRDSDDLSTRRGLESGLRVLGLYISKRGWLSEHEIDWDQIRDDILAARDDMVEASFSNARWVFNRLRDVARIKAAPWGRVRTTRSGLVPSAAIDAAVERGDWSGWVNENGESYAGLLGPAVGKGVRGEGLRAFMAWQDERHGVDELAGLGLPARHRVNPSERQAIREEKKRRTGTPDFTRGQASLRQGLSQLNVAAGFAARHLGVDWTTMSPAIMLTPEFAEAFASDWRASRKKPAGNLESHPLMATFQQLGRMASPFLRARIEANDARAEELDRASTTLLTHAEHYRPLPTQEKLKFKVMQWQADGEEGYLKVYRLRDILIEEIIALAGNLSLEDQLERLASHTLVLRDPSKWARAVRMACMLDFALRVPARSENIGGLREAWVKYGQPDRPWEGSIRVFYPEFATKAGKAISPWLALESEECVDIPSFNRTLFGLYKVEGGARAILLTPRSGAAPLHSDFLFVAQASTVCSRKRRKKADPDFQWSTVSAEFHRLVNRLGKAVGLAPSSMTGGAKGIHILRHLFATFFLLSNADYAAKMLGHGSVEMTRTHYAWIAAEHFRPDVEMAAALARKGRGVTPLRAPDERPECVACFEPLNVRHGVVASRCHACRKDQAEAA